MRYLEITNGNVINVVEWDGISPFNPPGIQLVSAAAGYAIAGRRGLVKMGANTHIGSYGSDVPATIATAMTYLNGNMFRDNLWWNLIEPTRGALAYPGSNTGMQKLDQMIPSCGEPLLVLGFGNAAYGTGDNGGPGGYPLDVDELQGFSNYVSYIVGKLVGRCSLFELWNEWNLGDAATAAQVALGFQNDVSKYTALVAHAYPVLKAANPDAKLLVGSIGEPFDPAHSSWLDQLLATPGLAADGISFHHYYGMVIPDTWFPELLSVIGKIQAALGPSMPVYLTETGWFNGSAPQAISQTEAAIRYSRLPFLLRALPLDAVTFYDLRDDGPDLSQEQQNFGIFTTSYQSKLQTATLRDALTHIQAVTGAWYFLDWGRFRDFPAVVSLEISGGWRLACWTLKTSEVPLRLMIMAANSGTLSIQQMGGSTTTLALVAGSNSVEVRCTQTAIVISADVSIYFPDYLPVGESAAGS